MEEPDSQSEHSSNNQEAVVDFFRLHVRLFGDDWRALGWHSRKTQYRRFDVLCGVGELAGKRILDIGCGLGDLYGYFRESDVKLDYTGCDLLPEMVERASLRYPEALFFEQDVLQGLGDTRFDYILSSGAFNIDFGNNLSAVKWTLQLMIEHCIEGVAINFLSTSDSERDPMFYHYDPQLMLEYAQSISMRAELREGYLPNDFTLYLYP